MIMQTRLGTNLTSFEVKVAAGGFFQLTVTSQDKLPPARLVIHQHTPHRAHVRERCLVQTGPGIWRFSSPASLAAGNGGAQHYRHAPRGGRYAPVHRVLDSEPSLRLRIHRLCNRSRPLCSTFVE